MKQPHTEQTIQHTDDQQNTGNHKKPDASDKSGADKFGGTRAGASNVEKASGSGRESIEQSTDVDRVSGLDEVNTSTKPGSGDNARSPERDERGRI